MLEEARALGFLGPGPVEAHLGHAAGFGSALAQGAGAGWPVPRRAADLGSGGGVPGLVLALAFPATEWVLIEVAARRAAFLRRAVEALGIVDRTAVVDERAEVVGRSADHRGRFNLLVARSFGPPAVVAECAAPLLRVDGRAVISEPPGGSPARWPVDGLAVLGMAPGAAVVTAGAAYQVLRQEKPCPDRWPRRVGVPGKRPLF